MSSSPPEWFRRCAQCESRPHTPPIPSPSAVQWVAGPLPSAAPRFPTLSWRFLVLPSCFPTLPWRFPAALPLPIFPWRFHAIPWQELAFSLPLPCISTCTSSGFLAAPWWLPTLPTASLHIPALSCTSRAPPYASWALVLLWHCDNVWKALRYSRPSSYSMLQRHNCLRKICQNLLKVCNQQPTSAKCAGMRWGHTEHTSTQAATVG